MDEVVITNHGPGDVYDLDFVAPDNSGLITRPENGFPVPKLPPGKSVLAFRSLALEQEQYFTITLIGRTADGIEIKQEEFVSGS